jgi:hypothetical protein
VAARPRRTLAARAARVKLLVLDVDGVLTDGGLLYGPSGEEWKRFDVQDGLAVVEARRAGLELAVISGRASPAVTRRLAELGVTEVHQAVSDKGAVLAATMAVGQKARIVRTSSAIAAAVAVALALGVPVHAGIFGHAVHHGAVPALPVSMVAEFLIDLPVALLISAAVLGLDAWIGLPGIFAVTHAQNLAVVSRDNPARAGELVTVFATGLGPVSPPVSTGQVGSIQPLSLTVSTAVVNIGGRPAQVQFSGLAPTLLGLYQINAQVAADTPSGEQDLVLEIAGQRSRPVKIWIR